MTDGGESRSTIPEAKMSKGLRLLLYDGMCSQVMGVLTTGAFLVAFALLLGAALSLLAGLGVDAYAARFAQPLGAYSILFVVGSASGLASIYFVGRVPEPAMAPVSSAGIWSTLMEPFRNGNFRKLLTFLGLWNFAINLAGPFFAVYMLQRLGLAMSYILVFAVMSQFVNVLFFRLWGRLADRFSNKSCLAVSGPLFIFTFLLWPFTTMPERYLLTLPLLVIIHILAGISTAGVGLCAGNLALKAAPYGRATLFYFPYGLIGRLRNKRFEPDEQ